MFTFVSKKLGDVIRVSPEQTPFMKACWAGHEDVVKLLLKPSMNIDLRCMEIAVVR